MVNRWEIYFPHYFPTPLILNCTLPRCLSTFSTRTCTTCPTATTLSGSFTYLSAISEICTRPSCLTPISTKAPNGRGQSIARVKTRLFQVLEDVVESGKADADFFGDLAPGGLFAIAAAFAVGTSQAALQFDELAELRDALGRVQGFALLIIAGWQHGKQGAGSGVALRVDEGVVEEFYAVGDFEEACRLDKRCGTESGHFLQLFARFEWAVLLAVFDDGGGDAGVDARNVLE